MVIVGFDWARDKHDLCIQDRTGKVLHACSVAHDFVALEAVMELIGRFEADPSAVHVALEQHDGALLAWLLNTGFTVCAVNPKSADRARDVYRPAGGKDDRTDAQVVADLLRNNLQRDLLQRWPLQEDLAQAHGNSLNAFLSKARLPAATREKIGVVRNTAPLLIPEGRKRALRLAISAALEQLQLLIDRLAGIDQELVKAFADHPCFNVFHSLPVKGVPTLAMITAGFGDRRQDPTGWRKLAARWGVAPVTYASGKSRSVRRRKACDSHMCQALCDFAFTTAFSVSGCWSPDFYDRKRKAGGDHHESLRAVALRWGKIMWTMWNDGTTYDEHYHRRRQKDQLLG